MLDGRQAQRERHRGGGGVGLLPDQAHDLQLDRTVHVDRVLDRQLLNDRLDEMVG
jgi:hypothetical protein